MALINCIECSKQYSDQATACVHCGARNPNRKSPLRIMLLALAVLVSIILFGMVIAEGNPRMVRHTDADAINRCEAEYGRLKEHPGMTRDALVLAYETCQKLRQDYRDRWGYEP